jgi:hypothetical protein
MMVSYIAGPLFKDHSKTPPIGGVFVVYHF